MLNLLIGCEYSGIVRDAFRALGHYAMSCDLLASDRPGPHYRGDVRDVINEGWDGMICHPPCTYLTSAGLHWNKRRPERAQLTEEALRFVQLLLDAPIPHIGLENPVGCISTRIRRPDQIIQPYEFGEDASKATCLWLKDLPLLTQTRRLQGRMVSHQGRTVERWSNQTDSGQNKLPPTEDRWKIRSTTYPGIAQAMAEQWSVYIMSKRREAANDTLAQKAS